MSTTTTTTTRQDVISSLRRLKAGATAADLAKRLKTTERAVRRHLAALHAEKRVVRTFFYEGTPAVGRYRYTITSSEEASA